MAARDRVKELRDQHERGNTDKWEFVAGSSIAFWGVGSRDEREETRSALLHILGLPKMTQFENNMKQSESSADRSKHQGELANWLKHPCSNSSRIPRLQEHLNKRDAENNKRIDVSLPNLHKLCSLHCLALERKVTFVQIATQPFEDEDREAAVKHQSDNAGPPLLLGVLPWEEAFLEWFVEKGPNPDNLDALKKKSEELDLEEKENMMKALAHRSAPDTRIKVRVPCDVLHGQDKDLVSLADLKEKREVMENMRGLQLNVPEWWWKNAETGKQLRSTKIWSCTIVHAKLSTAGDADPCFVIECDDPDDDSSECGPYDMPYSEVRNIGLRPRASVSVS